MKNKMKTLILVLLAAAPVALAQTPPAPNPPPAPAPPGVPGLPQPTLRAPGHLPAPGNHSGLYAAPPRPEVNYRLRLEIKEGKEALIEISVVSSQGKIRAQMMNPKRTLIDDREVPSTMDFTASLSPLEGDRCQVTLFLGRSIPYVTSRSTGPEGKGVSQYQQMQVGLDTTVILKVGKPLVIESDPTQQVQLTLEKPAE